MSNGISLVVTTIAPRRPLLARALASIGAQTLLPEVVVITEDTRRLGAARNRQNGTDQVATEFVAYLDDDDELDPPHLERLAAEMNRTGADLIFPWFTVVGGTDPFPHSFGRPWDNTEPHQIPVTFLARTEVIREAGGWTLGWEEVDAEDPGTDRDGNRAGEDWRLCLRLCAMDAKIVHLPERTWRWHHDSGNTSGLPSRVRWDA